MDSNQSYTIISAVVMLALVASSLIARRLPISTIVKYCLAWAVIFGGVYGVVVQITVTAEAFVTEEAAGFTDKAVVNRVF